MADTFGFDQLAPVLRSTQTMYLAQATAFLFFVYDILTTLREETQTIWKLRWTIPKTLYMLIRYYGVFTLLADVIAPQIVDPASSACKHWLDFASANHTFIMSVAVNGLFLLRLFALYRNNIIVTTFLCLLYLVELSFMIAAEILAPPQALLVSIPNGPSVQACINAAMGPKWLGWATQIMCLCRSGIYLALVLKRWHKYTPASDMQDGSFMNRVLRRQSQAQPRFPSLLSQFIRDEAVVFVVISLMQVIMTTLLFTPKMGVYLGAAFQWFFAAVAICATRLVLNLRSRFSEPSVTQTRTRSQSLGLGNPVRVQMQRTHEVSVSDEHGEWKAEGSRDGDDAEMHPMKIVQDSPLPSPMAH